jgi:hypothetical protein
MSRIADHHFRDADLARAGERFVQEPYAFSPPFCGSRK